MSVFAQPVLRTFHLCLLALGPVTLPVSAADTAGIVQFEEMTAQLSLQQAPTKAVAQTLVQVELHRAYRAAEKKLCDTGWMLMGTLVNSDGPTLTYPATSNDVKAQPAVWTFKTRRKFETWTCNANLASYLDTVRSFLPDWISVQYLADETVTGQKQLAAAQP